MVLTQEGMDQRQRDRLPNLIKAISDGTYTEAKDLPFSYGVNRRLWLQARLVMVWGIDIDKALRLSAAQCSKSIESVDVAKAVDDCLLYVGNVTKCVSPRGIRRLVAEAQRHDPEEQKPTTRLILAINYGQEEMVRKILTEA